MKKIGFMDITTTIIIIITIILLFFICIIIKPIKVIIKLKQLIHIFYYY